MYGERGVCAGAYRVQETAQDALELDLQAGGRPGSWERAVVFITTEPSLQSWSLNFLNSSMLFSWA